MDLQRVREYAQQHGDAVVRGDAAAAAQDCAPEAFSGLAHVGARMPERLDEAAVVAVVQDGQQAVVDIRYAGAEGHVTVRSVWEERGDRPLVVSAAVL